MSVMVSQISHIGCLFNTLLWSTIRETYWPFDGITGSLSEIHGPLAKYVKLRAVHAPGMPVTFSPPKTSKETAN